MQTRTDRWHEYAALAALAVLAFVSFALGMLLQ